MLLPNEQHLFLSNAQYWVWDIPAPADTAFNPAVTVLRICIHVLLALTRFSG